MRVAGTGEGEDSRGREVTQTLLLALGVGLALQLLDGRHGTGATAHPAVVWLRDAALAAPLAMLAGSAGAAVSRRLLRAGRVADDAITSAVVRASSTSASYALVLVPATFAYLLLFPAPGSHAPPAIVLALGNAALAMLVGFVLLAVAELAGLDPTRLPAGLRRPVTRRRTCALGVVAAMVATLLLAPLPGAPREPAQAASAACSAATADRDYDVAAINVHVPYNRWGQGNQTGMVYALQGDKEAIRSWHRPLGATGSNRRLRPRPLVLRANEGECVAVRFTNELDPEQGEGLPHDPRSSIALRGVPFDVQSSGGGRFGYNDDSAVGIGETTTYLWTAPEEGIYFYNDTAIPAGGEGDGGSLANGLYGAFVVEPRGSTWTDPVSGDPLYTGTVDQSGELYIDAVITQPDGFSFRESVQLAQDEMPHTSTFAFNYGSEPTTERDPRSCADCVGEETSLSSWVYGDPALVKLASGLGPWRPGTPEGEESCGLGTRGFEADSCFTSNVTHAYPGDPTKIRYGMAGVKETHVFHMHAHQWLADDEDVGAASSDPTAPGPGAMPESTTVDSQTFGPMEMFTADLLFGAGSKNRTVGDSIFHCHLYPHFVEGFWALFRVHDVREDGSGSTPDGIHVSAVQPLPAADSPPRPTPDNPGFPRFIPGEVGWRPPQAPLGTTRDGVPEPRYVAGRQLEPASPEVALEQLVMQRMSGGDPKPGAPFNDPCPSGAREVTYKVSVIQTTTVHNERGDFDSQARILVLDRDVPGVLSGRKKPTPLFVRVNAGDCINWQLTNRLPNWFGNDAFQKLVQTNMFGQHIHLVKFDVLASDGATNGWNYQQAAYSAAQDDFNDQIAANPSSCTDTDCRLALPADHDPFTSSSDVAPGQTITERWFADYELRTVFTHDHHFAAVDQNRGQYGAVVVEPRGTDFRDPVTGAWFQPVNDPAHGTVCGRDCEGGAAGTALDVIGPGPNDDFRDFGLAFADFVPLTRGGGDPQNPDDVINPPSAPEDYPNDDPGGMAINYRNAPLELRRTKNGQRVDPAYVFSSHVFGDPSTPVLQTYNGDDVRIRVIQGAHEEQHYLKIHGVRWRKESDDPQSHFVDASSIGVSEAFNFEAPRFSCPTGRDCRGDYLYSSGSADDLAMGLWGLLRVNGGRVPRLLPLPDNVPQRAGTVPSPSPTALAAPRRAGPGDPCPAGAPRRRFSVVAMQTPITYNEAGDHDPYGLVYALAKDVSAIRKGRNPEPLVLRANEGDCIELTLTNRLTPRLQSHGGEGDAELPTPSTGDPRVPGLRVSMHAGLLSYDVRGSDGATVGYNPDQTVGPTDSMTYRWYAEDVTPGELGAVNLMEYGDVLGHRHHGLFGGLIVEPRRATWHHPVTGVPLASGGVADIRVRGGRDFREATLFSQDGLNLRTADGSFIDDPAAHPATPGEPEEALDAEDSGEKAYSYRNEPFRHRLGYEPMAADGVDGAGLAGVYDSRLHGDPATPRVRAYEGDELRMRVLQGADKPRQHAFGLAGHSFRISPHDPGSRRVGVISGLGVGSVVNAHMGAAGTAGDYPYGSAVGFFHRSGGLWGLMRVYPRPASAVELLPTRVGSVDDPRRGGHPLLPLELDQVRATVFLDDDGDRVRDAGERLVGGARVRASRAGRVVASATSSTAGAAYLSVRRGTHAISVSPPSGYVVESAPTTVTTAGNNQVRDIRVALRRPTATVSALVFADRDRDRRRDGGESAVRGARVRLVAAGRVVASALSTRTGVARLRVPPGVYGLRVVAPRGMRLTSAPARVRTGPAGSTRRVWIGVR